MPGEEDWKGSAFRRLKGYVTPSNYYKSMCQKKKKKQKNKKKKKKKKIYRRGCTGNTNAATTQEGEPVYGGAFTT